MLTFTQMDIILKLEEGDHYFKVPARQGLIFTATLNLRIVANKTDMQHRFVMVELARKSQLDDVWGEKREEGEKKGKKKAKTDSDDDDLFNSRLQSFLRIWGSLCEIYCYGIISFPSSFILKHIENPPP